MFSKRKSKVDPVNASVSNEAKPRSAQEISMEYTQVSSQLGELEFQYRTIPGRQDKLIARIKELDEEFQAVNKAMQEAGAKAAAQAKENVERVKAEQEKLKGSDAQP